MADTYLVRVIDRETGEVVRTFKAGSEREADRIERGVSINLHHGQYRTELVHTQPQQGLRHDQ